MSTVQVKALIGKERDPVSWDEEVWEDRGWGIGPLNSDESSFPVEEVSITLMKEDEEKEREK